MVTDMPTHLDREPIGLQQASEWIIEAVGHLQDEFPIPTVPIRAAIWSKARS